nr:EOG090X0MNC [Eubosmina coregoni]
MSPGKKSEKRKSKTSSKALELVKQANAQLNPLDPLPAFQAFNKNGLNVQIKCCQASELGKALVDWTFNLLMRNMKKMYEESDWGWDEKEKLNEMTEDAAWYLIATTSDGKPVAFSHFRFDVDYGNPVVYCYEMQLEVECRRKGLGRFLLQTLELMAFKSNMSKIVLTVFKHNPAAVTFFKSLGYIPDETSPINTLEDQFDYEILSKQNKRKTD